MVIVFILSHQLETFLEAKNSEFRCFVQKNSECTAVSGSASRPHRLFNSKLCRFFDQVSTIHLDFFPYMMYICSEVTQGIDQVSTMRR